MRSLSLKSIGVRWAALAASAVFLCGCPSRTPSETKAEPALAVDGEGRAHADEESSTDTPAEPSTGSLALDTNVDRLNSLGDGDEPPGAAKIEDPLAEAQRGTWSTRRLVGLAQAGPLVLDLSVSVDGVSLEEATDIALASVADEILSTLASPVTWMSVLEQPLVRSGWLGNIIAPSEQQSELVSMYDANADGLVDAVELRAFLSRGLSRAAPLVVADGRAEAGAVSFASPWGIADLNNDNTLDATELEQLVDSLSRLDSNGDSTITLQEVTERQMAQAEGMMSTDSRLPIESVVIVDPSQSSGEEAEAVRARRRTVSNLLRHYTFLETIPRDQWPAWSESAWAKLDSNSDQSIDSREAQGLFTGQPQATLYVRLPALTLAAPVNAAMSTSQSSTASTTKSTLGPSAMPGSKPAARWLVACSVDDSASWKSHPLGGRLTAEGCSVRLQINDGFDRIAQLQLRRQLELALTNEQFKLALTQQFQLGDMAFDLLDGDGDQQLSDAEFAGLWRWFTARQGARTVARWTVASHPWFQLGDTDGDGRLTELEVSRMHSVLQRLDRDGDGQLTPYELPLLVTLELTRADPRLANFQRSGEAAVQENAAVDWFSAMDSNGDGVLSRHEFLGSKSDFEHLDVDKDGFVAPGEVYLAP